MGHPDGADSRVERQGTFCGPGQAGGEGSAVVSKGLSTANPPLGRQYGRQSGSI